MSRPISRSSALLSALAVLAAAVAAFVVVRRLTAPRGAGMTTPAELPLAADAPGPVAVPSAAPAPAADAVRAVAAATTTGRAEPTERPLPTWVRVTIVAAALAAFFAVSLIATRNV